jgi:hypothetical protein
LRGRTPSSYSSEIASSCAWRNRSDGLEKKRWGVVRVNLAEQAVQQLSRVQEVLTLIMGRLSLQNPGTKNTEETQRNQGES